MFEHHTHPLLPQAQFLGRLALSISAGFGLIGLSLWAGMAGYHYYEGMTWLDAFLNASMILSGMGPLAQPQSVNGKLFAGMYALYSGFVVIFASGIIFAPVIHRTLHRFHIERSHHTPHRPSPTGSKPDEH
ncbi:MAG: hypothetical protein AABP62_22820 [Planctomycetota bacterium]